jgi:enoyl-CoA hydratase/carnithine racemase
MDYDEIVYEKRNDAAWIGINRPEVRNAFREQTLDELAHALRSTRQDPTIVAAVVYGVGGHFSAGGDFHAMMKLNKANSYMWNDRMLEVAMTCRNLPIPVIAMVEGACVGGGHELMLWCDLVITAEDATFGQTGARVGACPTVGATQYIAKLIGERRAKEMIFLCKRYTGAEAASIGLANEAWPAAGSRAGSRRSSSRSRATRRRHSGRRRSRSTSTPTPCIRPGSTAWSCWPTSGARRRVWRG